MRPLTFATGCAPFLFRGGPVGCLLIHGLTGTPHDMRRLGEHLAARGYTVLGPRLTHHATHPEDMNRSAWHDWYLAALDGWQMLDMLCEQVVVVGVSAGGVTALLLASREAVSGVVSIAAPMMPMTDWRVRLARTVSSVLPFVPKSDPGEQLESERLYTSYPVWPTNAVVELTDYLRHVNAALPAITAPALVMHATEDDTVPLENATYIYDRLGSAAKEKVIYEVAEHVLTDGSVTPDLFARVTAFVEKVTGSADQAENIG